MQHCVQYLILKLEYLWLTLTKQKQRLLDLKQEYQTRVHKIQHDMQNPDTDMTQDWDDQTVINEQNDVRKTY